MCVCVILKMSICLKINIAIGHFTVGGAKFTVEGAEFTVVGAKCTVGGAKYTVGEAGLGSRSSELGVFGSLEPEPLEKKKTGAGAKAAW